MTDVPELLTERLRMRAPRYDDYERWAEFLADPAVGAGLGKPNGLTPHEAWLDMSVLTAHWALRGFGHWVLEEHESGEVVGRAGLYHPPDWPGLEVGWTVAREHWGKGYAPEAGRAACEWAHHELGVRHILSLIHPENDRSIRVAEKLGATLEGRHTTRGFELLVYGVDLPLGDSPAKRAGTRPA
jgi:RimJ/RimL family protein N-acetyltransferase